MSTEPHAHKPTKKEILDDNARKFIVNDIDPTFLNDHTATSYTLTTDWLETGEDSEKKIAYKKFDNGDIQILLIAKTTEDDSRTSIKEKITEEEYKTLLNSSTLHLEKKRYEFEYMQNDILFSMKYDEFTDSKLRILEVDASSKESRNSFRPNDFPAKAKEVTGDINYYGYRVIGVL